MRTLRLIFGKRPVLIDDQLQVEGSVLADIALEVLVSLNHTIERLPLCTWPNP